MQMVIIFNIHVANEETSFYTVVELDAADSCISNTLMQESRLHD